MMTTLHKSAKTQGNAICGKCFLQHAMDIKIPHIFQAGEN